MARKDQAIPEHKIDQASLDALPEKPGIYIFKGEGTFPLFIGKSLDIRTRVMSHLRATDDVRLVAQTRRVDFIETIGEIGALLLESRMIKDQNPLFNQGVKRVQALYSIRLRKTETGFVTEIVDSKKVNLGSESELFGFFSSSQAANAKLKELSRQHLLCMSVLGLEKASSRGCFGLQVKACLGACIGKENRHVHDERLFTALLDSKVEIWPFAGAVDLIEESVGWVQKHRLNNWCYLGSQCSKTGEISKFYELKPHDFDLDSYKILFEPIMLKTVKVELVQP